MKPAFRPGRVGAAPPAVGVLFNPALAAFVDVFADAIDHLSVIPDRCWIDPGPGRPARFQPMAAPTALIDRVARHVPLVLHAIGLSICSADVFDEAYVLNLERWRRRWQASWVSEHLSFSRVGADHEVNAALALPVPLDDEVLDLVARRVRRVQSVLGGPFLLENGVAYVDIPDQGMDEPTFLNRLCERTGCGLLLDLHNLHTNATNHGFDALDYLGALDLAQVVEVHVAGGEAMMGFHTDSHSGPVDPAVWRLLEALAPRAPALRAVTFEFHESCWPRLRAGGVLEQISRAREVLASTLKAEQAMS